MLYDSFDMKYPKQATPKRQKVDQLLSGTEGKGKQSGC